MSINEACNLVISASLIKKKFATFVQKWENLLKFMIY